MYSKHKRPTNHPPKILKPTRPWSKIYDHIIYAVPTFANPSGKMMSLQRRKQLIQVARRYNALVITDDVYDFLQWPTKSPSTTTTSPAPARTLLPRLSDIDRLLPPHPSDPYHFGHTLSNASFSKILAPGVRTGWVDAMPALSFGVSQAGSSRSGGCPSQLVAAMITTLVTDGSLQAHIRDVLVPGYQRRHRLVMEAVRRWLMPLGVVVDVGTENEQEGGFGGYFVWLKLPEGVSADELAVRAKAGEELIVAPGGLFEVAGDEEAAKFDGWVRICFAWVDEDDLVEGVERLGRALKDTITAKE